MTPWLSCTEYILQGFNPTIPGIISKAAMNHELMWYRDFRASLLPIDGDYDGPVSDSPAYNNLVVISSFCSHIQHWLDTVDVVGYPDREQVVGEVLAIMDEYKVGCFPGGDYPEHMSRLLNTYKRLRGLLK